MRPKLDPKPLTEAQLEKYLLTTDGQGEEAKRACLDELYLRLYDRVKNKLIEEGKVERVH